MVREKTQKRQRQQEQDLLYGRVAANGDSATSAGPSWRQELKFPDWYPILLIVPTTVVQNWRNEFARFSHFSVATFDSDNRQKALESFSNGGAEIMLAAKSLFAQDRGFRELNKFPWKLVIIDEFHMFKVCPTIPAFLRISYRLFAALISFRSLLFGINQNPKGQLSTKLRKLKSDHRSLVLGMTGTLFQNDHMELWNLVDLVETGYLGDWDEFRNTTGKAIKLGR